MTKQISHAARALAIGVVAALVVAGFAGTSAAVETVVFQDSFESGNLGGWSYRENGGAEIVSQYNYYIDNSNTMSNKDGQYAIKFVTENAYGGGQCTDGAYQEIYKTIDFTNIDLLTFNIMTYDYIDINTAYYYYANIDGSDVWVLKDNKNHSNTWVPQTVSIDVSSMKGNHELRLGKRCWAGNYGGYNIAHWIDNIKGLKVTTDTTLPTSSISSPSKNSQTLIKSTTSALSLSNSGGGIWQSNNEITVRENSGSTLTDYQVLVPLSGSSFPTNARSDGADIRFTDADGNELNYWIESWDYSGRGAKIWVKVPSISADGTASIRMYYGNPSASSSSRGDTTFDFFEDFSGDLSKWTASNVEISGSVANAIANGGSITTVSNIVPRNAIVRADVKPDGDYDVDVQYVYIDANNYIIARVSTYSGAAGCVGGGSYGGKTQWDKVLSGTYYCLNTQLDPIIALNTWYRLNAMRFGTSYELTVTKLSDSSMGSTSATISDSVFDTSAKIKIYFQAAGGKADNIFVRKYATSEPTLTLGAELPTSTTAPTIAQTTIPTPVPTAAAESSNSYIYAGIGGLVLILVAIVTLRRRSSSKVEEPLKREPAVKPELQKPAPRHKEMVPGLMQTTAPVAEPPKTKPAPMTVPEAPGVYVKTAFGYKGAAIIYKLKIENNTSDPISDIKVYPYVPDVFLLRDKEKSIALIEPKASQTVTFEIRPTGECGDCNVSGRVNYYNMASRKRQDIELEQKSLSIVCPMLHGKEISETEWYDAVGNLVKTEESTREIEMPAESLFTMVSRVIKDMHMYMQKPEVTQNNKLFNGVARFYGEGVKGLKYAAQVEVVGSAKKSKLILKVWAEKEDALTGFYHGMLDEIEKRVNVKEYIDDSIVQYNVHVGDKIGTLVKDSVVQRSNIGASMRKCPDCGREVEANEKFCLECGAKL